MIKKFPKTVAFRQSSRKRKTSKFCCIWVTIATRWTNMPIYNLYQLCIKLKTQKKWNQMILHQIWTLKIQFILSESWCELAFICLVNKRGRLFTKWKWKHTKLLHIGKREFTSIEAEISPWHKKNSVLLVHRFFHDWSFFHWGIQWRCIKNSLCYK